MNPQFILAAGLGAALALGAEAAAAAPPSIDTAARNAVVVDFDTGTVLLDKGADQHIPPASMSKIMTAYVVYGYLKSGRAKLDDTLPVSEPPGPSTRPTNPTCSCRSARR